MANLTATAKAEIQDDTGKVIWGGKIVMTVPDSDPSVDGELFADAGVLTISGA